MSDNILGVKGIENSGAVSVPTTPSTIFMPRWSKSRELRKKLAKTLPHSRYMAQASSMSL